jgi:DNA polymerase III alpha subunit
MAGPPPGSGGPRIDLHCHTTFSDGELSPDALVRRAIARRVGVLSITDHDSVEALPAARAAAGTELELVRGSRSRPARTGSISTFSDTTSMRRTASWPSASRAFARSAASG